MRLMIEIAAIYKGALNMQMQTIAKLIVRGK